MSSPTSTQPQYLMRKQQNPGGENAETERDSFMTATTVHAVAGKKVRFEKSSVDRQQEFEKRKTPKARSLEYSLSIARDLTHRFAPQHWGINE